MILAVLHTEKTWLMMVKLARALASGLNATSLQTIKLIHQSVVLEKKNAIIMIAT